MVCETFIDKSIQEQTINFQKCCCVNRGEFKIKLRILHTVDPH